MGRTEPAQGQRRSCQCDREVLKSSYGGAVEIDYARAAESLSHSIRTRRLPYIHAGNSHTVVTLLSESHRNN